MPAETCNFLLLHGDVRQSFSYGKGEIDLSALGQKNVDYLALGHIHGGTEPRRLGGRGTYRYCGCLEGHGFDECGEKGFVLIEVADGIRQTFLPFASRAYHEISVDVSGTESNPQRIEKILAKTENLPSKDGIKIRLKGSVALSSPVHLSSIQSALEERFFHVKTEDETRENIDFSRYEKERTVKGELVRLASRLPEEERARVLTIAFRALNGEELDV